MKKVSRYGKRTIEEWNKKKRDEQCESLDLLEVLLPGKVGGVNISRKPQALRVAFRSAGTFG